MNKSTPLHDHVFQEPHGWLVDLVNRVSKEPRSKHTYVLHVPLFPCLVWLVCIFQFGELGGFTAIQAKLNTDEIEIAVSLTNTPHPPLPRRQATSVVVISLFPRWMPTDRAGKRSPCSPPQCQLQAAECPPHTPAPILPPCHG